VKIFSNFADFNFFPDCRLHIIPHPPSPDVPHHLSPKCEKNHFLISLINFLLYYRIIDNMPVTWCYLVEDGNQYCSRGFPLGCLVTKQLKKKDSCVMSVSYHTPLFSSNKLSSMEDTWLYSVICWSDTYE
jgi:hypothetical protein